MASAPTPGTQIPNWKITDTDGQSVALHDFRQKSHVVFVFEPNASVDMVQRWRQAIASDQKQWAWLQVTWVIAKAAPADAAPGAYVIDRYGELIHFFPAGRWKFDAIEREFIYYESCHC